MKKTPIVFVLFLFLFTFAGAIVSAKDVNEGQLILKQVPVAASENENQGKIIIVHALVSELPDVRGF